MWLWASVTGAGPDEIAVLWQAYLRRFDIEHTFLLQGSVGLLCDVAWTSPVMSSAAGLRGCGARGW
jgi:hypothetical protein